MPPRKLPRKHVKASCQACNDIRASCIKLPGQLTCEFCRMTGQECILVYTVLQEGQRDYSLPKPKRISRRPQQFQPQAGDIQTSHGGENASVLHGL
ncbi:hypothetical protein BT69DRAFT_503842 [Atractiella rhizophila]|nr:hypothetical protein BT69DRAFT_503842 [Atractiella rhizophila]